MTYEVFFHPCRFETLTHRPLMKGTAKHGVEFAFYQRSDGRCSWRVGTEFWTVVGSSLDLQRAQAEVQAIIQERTPQ